MSKLVKQAVKTTSKVAQTIVKAVEKVAAPVVKTAEAIVKNPLPVIETAALIATGVPPSVASAAVTAMNGGSVKDIVSNGLTAYVGSQVAGSVAGQLPEGTSATTAKIVSSAAGADAATTLKSLASGKSLDVALQDGLVAGASTGAGVAAGGLVEDKIGSGAASGAASGATRAALTGKDIVSGAITGAEQGALKPAEKALVGEARDALGNILPSSDVLGLNDTLSSIKQTVKPYVASAKEAIQPALTAAKETLKPVGTAISEAGKAVQEELKPVGTAISDAAKTVKQAAAPYFDPISGIEVPRNAITEAVGQAPNLYHDQQVMEQMAKTVNVPAPAGGTDPSTATTGSPAAYGAGDVAMLDATSPEGMGSKVSKKGGKYPWGDPEGTTALKQEGQVV